METNSFHSKMTSLNSPMTSQAQVFDWLENLEKDTDLSFVETLAHQFETHSEELLQGMQNDFFHRESKGLSFKAHKLKSAAGNLGSTTTWKTCQKIETLCLAENWDEISNILPILNQECDETYFYCKKYIDQKKVMNHPELDSDK